MATSTSEVLASSLMNALPSSTAVEPTATATISSTGATSIQSVVPVPVYISNSSSHNIAVGAGVGVAVGVLTAAILVLAFVYLRRRQMKKRGETISPDVLVTGNEGENRDSWVEEERSEREKEPPVYGKVV